MSCRLMDVVVHICSKQEFGLLHHKQKAAQVTHLELAVCPKGALSKRGDIQFTRAFSRRGI